MEFNFSSRPNRRFLIRLGSSAAVLVLSAVAADRLIGPGLVSGPVEWVLGGGHSIRDLLELERHPKELLDEAVPDLPVALMERSSHSFWVNSRALELAGNLPAFEDGLVHPTINLDNLDPACELPGLVSGEPTRPPAGREVRTILNMSFGMLGINSAVVVQRHEAT